MEYTCACADLQSYVNIRCHLESFQALSTNFGDNPCISEVLTIISLFSDRQVWANSVDPDLTAPEGSALFAILSASFEHINLWKKTHCLTFAIITTIVLGFQIFSDFEGWFMIFRVMSPSPHRSPMVLTEALGLYGRSLNPCMSTECWEMLTRRLGIYHS